MLLRKDHMTLCVVISWWDHVAENCVLTSLPCNAKNKRNKINET